MCHPCTANNNRINNKEKRKGKLQTMCETNRLWFVQFIENHLCSCSSNGSCSDGRAIEFISNLNILTRFLDIAASNACVLVPTNFIIAIRILAEFVCIDVCNGARYKIQNFPRMPWILCHACGGSGGGGNGHLFLEGVNVLSTRMIWHKSTAIWISRCVVTNVYKYISTPKIE